MKWDTADPASQAQIQIFARNRKWKSDVMPAVWKTDVASYIFFFQALANRSVQVELVL